MEKSKRKTIPIEHLTFEYISDCSKKNELEAIVRCLRNGDEGHFPGLTKFAETKLKGVAPNSSLLRETASLIAKREVAADYLREIESSLEEWEREMKCADAALLKSSLKVGSKLPPVRSATRIGAETCEKHTGGSSCQGDRIKRDDYNSWNKFDVDAALIKMDIEEERQAEETKKARLQNEKKQKDLANLSMNNSITPGAYSPEEAKLLSEKAKEKGNEYFKEGDWSRAYEYYTESTLLSPNCAAINNRALTLIKLGRFEEAVEDCNYVLGREPKNIKALLRRSTAYKCLPNQEHWRKALKDLETVISLEPNNKTAQNDYRVLRKQLKLPDETTKVRLEIEQVPRERLPLTYYGPSTSTFRCERNSLTHQMLAGPRMMCGDGVPCRCNRGAMKQNPICRNCGERQLRELREKSRFGRPVPRSMCAAYVVQQQNMRKNIAQSAPQKALNNETGVKPIENVQENSFRRKVFLREFSNLSINEKSLVIKDSSGDDNQSPVPAIVSNELQTTKRNGDKVSAVTVSHSESPVKQDNRITEESRERQLALKAKERGNESFAADDMKKALAYYSTSLNLYPDSHTLLLRAGVYEKLKKYNEAVADYSRVLETEPYCLNALLGRITAMFKVVPRNYKLITECVEKAYELRPDNNEIRMFHMSIRKEFSSNSMEEMATKTAGGEKTTSINTANVNQTCLEPSSSTANTNGHGLHEANYCSLRMPEEKKRERNQRNKKKRKKISENTSQEDVCSVVEPTKSDLSNGVPPAEKKKVVLGNLVSNRKNETDQLPSGFQFISAWETSKKQDPEYTDRVQLLRRVPPKQLVKVVGEKLDAEMLGDILHCLELMLTLAHENQEVADYMSVLPNLQRFQTIRLFMDEADSQRMDRIMKSLNDRNISISSTKSSTLI